MHAAYYNESEPFAAQWLRNLIGAGLIAPGEVDDRSIVDVRPQDLKGFRQCHFFAGIGVWSHALRRAGWTDDREVWTGSCPCQPFSQAGHGRGFKDERHLWPTWAGLVRERKPGALFGEQVASPDGLTWLDAVLADLERAGYACAPADLCAAGVGAPHIRQRLYFMAYARRSRRQGHSGRPRRASRRIESAARGELGNAYDARPQRRRERARAGSDQFALRSSGATRGFWAGADWILCQDGRWRPIESGTFPLAHGAVSRVGRLRAYGNAIVAALAAEFIAAAMEVMP